LGVVGATRIELV